VQDKASTRGSSTSPFRVVVAPVSPQQVVAVSAGIKDQPGLTGAAATRHTSPSHRGRWSTGLAYSPGGAALRHREVTGLRVAETLAPFKDYSRITADDQGGLQEGPGDSRPWSSGLPRGRAHGPSVEGRATINQAGASTVVDSQSGTAQPGVAADSLRSPLNFIR